MNIIAFMAMYASVLLLLAWGWLTPFAALVMLALPRARRAIITMPQPRPVAPPDGYVGWPLWHHRVCLVHNRTFGCLYLAGLALGGIWPDLRL